MGNMLGSTQENENELYNDLEFGNDLEDDNDGNHRGKSPSSSSSSINNRHIKVQSPTTANSKTPLIFDSAPKSPTSPLSPTSPYYSGVHTPLGNMSFIAEYHLEHVIDVNNDTVTGLALRYDVDRRESINSVHQSSKIMGDGGLNDLFHIEALFIPVQLKNVNNVVAYLSRCNSSTSSAASADASTKSDENDESDESPMELYNDSMVKLISYRKRVEKRKLCLYRFYAPTGTKHRTIHINDIVQLEWTSTDSLRGKLSIGLNLFQHEFASRIQQKMKMEQSTVTNGFLIYERDRVMPTFFTTENNAQFFDAISRILSSVNISVRNSVHGSMMFR